MKKRQQKAAESSSQVSTPLLWSARQVAFHCGLSVRSIWRAKSVGLLPPTVKVSSSVRWLAQDIKDWTSIGCPNQKEFTARKEAEQC